MILEIPKLIEKFGGTTVTNLLRLIDGKLAKVHTTTIGVIESFDAENQTAVIQPAIKRIITVESRETITYTSENSPLLVNVPIVFPGGGDWFMTFPVKKGDECLIFSMERSIGKWKKNGGVQDPSNYKRKLSFKDAVAMVGIQSKASSLPNFNTSEPEIRNRDGSIALTMSSSGMTLKGDLIVKGEIKADSEVSANNITVPVSLTTHVHPLGIAVSTTGTAAAQTGATTAPTSAPTPGT
jgi:hypothetical protein